MTVHEVTICSEYPDGITLDQIRQAVQNWVDNHDEWLGDDAEQTVDAVNTKEDTTNDGVQILAGEFRFNTTTTKVQILDDAEATLQNYVAWYRLGYHVCDHDETDPGQCDFTDQREYNPGQIPPGVGTFT